MTELRQARFVTGSLMRHVAVMALSGTLGLSFTFLVDFLALWWVSRLGDEAMLAAVGIAGTIQFGLMSVGIGLMIAGVALVARSIGQGDRQRARRIATFAAMITVGAQAALALASWIWRMPLLAASGAEGEVLVHADRFLAITLPSMPVVALGIMASGLLRAAGDAWRSMAVTMAGGAVAAVLDPIFIVWMEQGVTGAGWSMLIARTAMCITGVALAVRPHDLFAMPTLGGWRPFVRPFFAVALPAIATQLSTPFGNWILTREVAAYGESAVAGWGVVMRLTILAFGGIFALSGAIGGIIGQNYGARRPDRVAEAFVAALKFCLIYTAVVWAGMALLTGPIIASFGLSSDGAAIVRSFTTYAAGGFVFTGALFVSNAAFNNLSRPLWSTGANWFRDGLLMLPLSLAATHALGAEGVIWANACANVIAGTLAGWVAWHYIRSLNPAP